MRARTLVLGLSAAIGLASGTRAAPTNPPAMRTAVAPTAIHRVIVKLRSVDSAAPSSVAHQQRQAAAGQQAIAALAARNGLTLARTRSILPGLHVMELAPQTAGESLQASLARLRADPAVEYAEPDQRRYVQAVPNDPLYLPTPGATGQWYLQTSPDTVSAVDAIDAWTGTTGSDGLVIADVDTGVRFDHPDLGRAGDGNGGRLLPGYTFVSNVLWANDGAIPDGQGNAPWNADASDPGDWISLADTQIPDFSSCTTPSSSSWHGTRVVGILGAITNDSAGIAGLTWHGWILPVRALGKCGGADSDIETAMLWAAGVQVLDDSNNPVPLNPYPANIINLSLGAPGACPQDYVDVINQLTALGVTVVAAAGNEGGPVDAPGNCPNVIAVAGLRQVGTKVGFSSLGPEIALSAPGGNCVNTNGGPCLFSLDTTTNLGTTTPGPTPASDTYTNQTNVNVGTSFATPLVAGTAGLMLSVNANLTPAQIATRLQTAATTFPVSSDSTIPMCHAPTGASDLQTSECNCTAQTCGAGMLNANAAVTAALRPIAAIKPPTAVTAGQNVLLDATGSAAACSHTITSYAWSIVSGSGSFSGPSNQSTATVVAPSSGSYTVQVLVTDDSGRTDTAQVLVSSSAATSTAPASAGTHACLTPITPVLPITVTVSPSSASVQTSSGTQLFSAAVTSTSNQNVTWQVNGVPGGNSTVGTISSAGVYSAPKIVPASVTVSVIAVSDADQTKTGLAGVTIVGPPVQVTVAPSHARVLVGAPLLLTASVTNTTNTAVTWTVNGIAGGNATIGTITSTGLYTAPLAVPSPALVTVAAVSVVDSTRSGSAQVTVAPANVNGGGGGAMGGPGLLALCLLAAMAVLGRRHRSTRATQRSPRPALAGLTLALLAATGAAHGESHWVAGVNYFVINPAQPTGLPAGKIEVTEIFSYACPGCNRFYPVADRLQASLPANAVLDYLPASFRPDEDWPMFQRAYFAAKQLGIDKRTHAAMFDAVWKSGELAVFDPATQRPKRPAPTIADAAKFYAQAAGVKPETFMATAASFAVDVSMKQADDSIRSYGVAETPSIVVNGKYRLNPVSAGGYDQTIELVKWLVAQETRPGDRK